MHNVLFSFAQQRDPLEFVGMPEHNAFPRGEGIVRPSSLQTPIDWAAEETDIHNAERWYPLRGGMEMTASLFRIFEKTENV